MKKSVFSTSLSSLRNKSSRNILKSRRLYLENLEDRALLSATPNDPDVSPVVEAAPRVVDAVMPILFTAEDVGASAAPDVPTNLSIGEYDVVTGTQIISWDAVEGATSYVFQFRNSADGEWNTLTAKGRVNVEDGVGTALVANKYAGAKYQYRVQAVNEFGASDFATTEVFAPKAELTSVAIDSEAFVIGQTLSTSLSAAGPFARNLRATYQWYRGDGETWTEIDGATAATYVPTLDDADCLLRVVATAKGDAYYGVVEATIEDSHIPGAPTNVAISEYDYASGTQFISWDADPRATSYVFQYKNTLNGEDWNTLPQSRISIVDDRVEALVANKYAGKQYQYRVQAINGFGASEFTTTDPYVMTAPLASVTLDVAEVKTGDLISTTIAADTDFAVRVKATYQWYRGDGENWEAIDGATKAMYRACPDDAGYCLKVEATGASPYYYGTVEATTAVVEMGSDVPSTFVTTSKDVVADDGMISLREAVAYAAEYPELGGVVTFDELLTDAPITLDAQLELNQSVVIDASALVPKDGGSGITIDAQQNSRAIYISGDSTEVGLISLTITGGKSADFGGGLFAESGFAALINCNVVGNSALNGAGLYIGADGAVSLDSTSVSGNMASVNGGGLYVDGTALASNATIMGNVAFAGAGGIIVNEDACANFEYTIVSLNVAVRGAQNVIGEIQGSHNVIDATPIFPDDAFADENFIAELGE